MSVNWSLVVTESFQDLWRGVLDFAPNIIVAVLIIIIGWLVGLLLGRFIEQIVKGIKLDLALSKAGVDALLRKGDINLNSGAFIGGLVKWFIIVAFLVAAFDVLQLQGITEFFREIVLEYIPKVIVAALILLLSGVLGDVVAKIIRSSSKAAGISSTRVLASVSKWAIWIFAILVALQQLEIAEGLISTIFMGIIGALAIAIGLSFGLGGREVAGKIVSNIYDDLTKRD